MPIYEFYCPTCHVVFSFFSRTMDTTKRPNCPDCGSPDLERQLSRFAISKVQRDSDPQNGRRMQPADEKLACAMSALETEHDKMDHDDPKHAIPMIKGIYEIADMPIPERAREAISRLEAGADMESVSAEFGDIWTSEDSPFAKGQPLHGHFPSEAPRVDETLYEL